MFKKPVALNCSPSARSSPESRERTTGHKLDLSQLRNIHLFHEAVSEILAYHYEGKTHSSP